MLLRFMFTAFALLGILTACSGEADLPYGIRAGATGPTLHERKAVVPGVSEVAASRYYAVMDSDEPERDVLATLARDQGVTVAEVRASIDSAMQAIFQGEAVNQDSLRAAVEALGNVQVLEMIPAGDYVAIRYVQQFQANDDSDVITGIQYGMPVIMGTVLNAAPRIKRVRLVAHYPSTEGKPLRVALLTVKREDYDPARAPSAYPGYEPAR
jgi:hypothetical protein